MGGWSYMPVGTLAALLALLAASGAAAKSADQVFKLLKDVTDWLDKRKAAHEAQKCHQQEVATRKDITIQTQSEQNKMLMDVVESVPQEFIARAELVPQGQDHNVKLPALLRSHQPDPEMKALLERSPQHWRPEDVITSVRKRTEIEDFFGALLESSITSYSREQEQELSAVFSSKEALLHALRTLRTQHGIFVLPTYPTNDPQFALIPAGLRNLVNEYNAACAEYPPPGVPVRRSTPPLLMPDDLLHQSARLSRSAVDRIHAYLGGFPTICLQIAADGENVRFESWCWLRADDSISTLQVAFPLAGLQRPGLTIPQAIAGLSQLYLLLQADALSVGGFEGVSVLSHVLTKNPSADTVRTLSPWYSCLWRVFGEHYGAVGLQGIPQPDDDHRLRLRLALADLRWEVARRNWGALSSRELVRHGHYFVALANTLMYPFSLTILAIGADTPETAPISRWIYNTEVDMRTASDGDWQTVLDEGAHAFHETPHVFLPFRTGLTGVPELAHALIFE